MSLPTRPSHRTAFSGVDRSYVETLSNFRSFLLTRVRILRTSVIVFPNTISPLFTIVFLLASKPSGNSSLSMSSPFVTRPANAAWALGKLGQITSFFHFLCAKHSDPSNNQRPAGHLSSPLQTCRTRVEPASLPFALDQSQ